MKNMNSTEQQYYKFLVQEAQRAKTLDPNVREDLLKDYIFKHLVNLIRSDPSKPNGNVLQGQHLKAIVALVSKDNQTDEEKAFVQSYHECDKALTRCAQEIVAASQDPKTQPSTLLEVVTCAGIMIVALDAMFITMSLFAAKDIAGMYGHLSGKPKVNSAPLRQAIRIIISPDIMKLAIISALILGTATAVTWCILSKSKKEFQAAMDKIPETLDSLQEGLKTLAANLEKAKKTEPQL